MGCRAMFVVLVLIETTRAFNQKSECLLDYNLGGLGEYEGEDHEERQHGGQAAPGDWAGEEYHRSSEEAEDMGRRHLRPGGSFNSHRSHWAGGHNPMHRQGGRRYLDEEGEWEDARKRRKRGDSGPEYQTPQIQDSLVGRLLCSADALIHVLNVTVGYSNTQHCYQASPGCQAGSSVAKQVINCQGNTGVCGITIGRHFLVRCGHQSNFALIYYECIPAASRVDICSTTNSDVPDALVLTSTNYPRISKSPATASSDIVACECTLRAPANSHLELEYLRTHLPISGSACTGDMLLLERPDSASEGRYLMEREVCGHNVSNHLTIADHILRVTFLTGAPLLDGKSGFIAKFKAMSALGTNETFHVSCAGAHQGAVPDTQPKLVTSRSQPTSQRASTPTLNSSANAGRLLEWMKANGRTLPPNLDPSNLPANVFNMTREELQSRLLQTRAQSQKILGAQSGDPHTMQASEDTALSSSSSSGVLSGVVASLSAVVLILGSIGALIFYRRRQGGRLQGKQPQQSAPTLSDTVPCVKDDQTHSCNTGTSTGVARSAASRKNKDRPLPTPDTDIESQVVTSNSLSKSGCVSSHIYSIAVTIPGATEGTSFTDIDSQKTPGQTSADTLARRFQSWQENSPSTFVPLAPTRSKRRDMNRSVQAAVEYMSPYDNASVNSNVGKENMASAEGKSETSSATLPTDNRRVLEDRQVLDERQVLEDRLAGDDFDDWGEENYSYIHDMQVDGQDNSQV